jgi:hypothetical protein
MTALGFDIGLTDELAARNSAHRQTAHACARAAAVPRNRRTGILAVIDLDARRRRRIAPWPFLEALRV